MSSVIREELEVERSSSLLCMPGELLLIISELLDIPSILTLRRACRGLHTVTRDVVLWSRIAKGQYNLGYSLERTYGPEGFETWLAGLSLQDLENLTIPAYYVNNRLGWLKPRWSSPYILPREPVKEESYIAIHLLDYRWLITASSEGLIDLVDLRRDRGCHRPLQYRLPPLPHEHVWSSCAATLSPSGEVVVSVTRIRLRMGLGCTLYEDPSVTFIISVSLKDYRCPDFQLICTMPSPDSGNVLEIQCHSDARSARLLLVRKYYCAIDILDCASLQQRAAITNLSMVCNILGLKSCGQYILCIKSDAFELYAISPGNHQTGLLGRHEFSDTSRFTRVSMSRYNAADGTVSVLVTDGRQALYLYQVRVSPAPGFRLILLAKYLLDPQVDSVTAIALGPEGKRGLWVESRGGWFESWIHKSRKLSTRRFVFAFSAPQPGVHPKEIGAEVCQELDGKFVYETMSGDPRENLCAFSEHSGSIFIGTSEAQIEVIDCLPRPPPRDSLPVKN